SPHRYQPRRRYHPPRSAQVRPRHRKSRIALPSHWQLLCYLIDAIGIERDVPFDLLYRRKWLLVRPHHIDGLLSSGRDAVVTAVAFIRTVGSVIRPFQLVGVRKLTRVQRSLCQHATTEARK